jgi:S-(hydroxymethyl)glutathione dehydrogenase/alcohol dehydrogenase
MKAAVYHGPQKEQTIEEVDVDTPREHEVLVRTAASGVCHSDMHYIDGSGLTMGIPGILGHEAAGVVEAVGTRVTHVQPGDHIIARGSFCGECAQCLTGNGHRCLSKPGRAADDTPRWSLNGERVHSSNSNISSFAEQMLLHERGLVKIDPAMPLDAAALIGCAVITGFGAAIHTAKVRPGSRVAVFGVGGIGLSAIQGARFAGARQIIAVDLVESKLDIAREFGATDGVDASRADPVEVIRDISGGGVDYAFEAIGNAKVAVQCVEALGLGGTSIQIGVISAAETVALNGRALSGEKSIKACSMGSNRFRLDFPLLVDLYLQGRIKLDEMISLRGPLEDVNEMFERMRGGEIARQVIMFD